MVDHVEGRGWYGLRRIAPDLAESATTDDRVKDRLGGWQDSETRKQLYQDRQTDELRAEAAKVRRALRLGGKSRADGAGRLRSISTAPEQQVLRKNRRDPFGSRRLKAVGTSALRKSGRLDSNP